MNSIQILVDHHVKRTKRYPRVISFPNEIREYLEKNFLLYTHSHQGDNYFGNIRIGFNSFKKERIWIQDGHTLSEYLIDDLENILFNDKLDKVLD